MQAEPILPQHSSVYSIVTEQILKQLESGVAPWHRPWTTRIPKNLVSGRHIVASTCSCFPRLGYGSPYWLTYKQATERGGHVRKGEHGTKVVFWKIGTRETEDADGDTVERKSILLRYYTVFNVEQCEGIAAPSARARRQSNRGMRTHRSSGCRIRPRCSKTDAHGTGHRPTPWGCHRAMRSIQPRNITPRYSTS